MLKESKNIIKKGTEVRVDALCIDIVAVGRTVQGIEQRLPQEWKKSGTLALEIFDSLAPADRAMIPRCFAEAVQGIQAQKHGSGSAQSRDSAVAAIGQLPPVERPKVIIARANIAITGKGVEGTEVGRRTQVVEAHYSMPDFIAQIQAKTSLSKSTVGAILLKSGRLQDATGRLEQPTGLHRAGRRRDQ